MKFNVASWDEIGCEWADRIIECDDSPTAIAWAIDPEQTFAIVHILPINQNGEHGYFIQYKADRGQLAVDVAMMFDKE